MSEQSMIEKAARAACAANNNGQHEFDATGLDAIDPEYQPEWKFYVAEVRAVIAALMEATPGMVMAGGELSRYDEVLLKNLNAMAIFKAMLRAVLNEGEGE